MLIHTGLTLIIDTNTKKIEEGIEHRVRSQPFDRLRAGSQNPVGQASLPAKEWSPDKHPESII